MESPQSSRVEPARLDIICDVVDLEVNVFTIVARDSANNLYAIHRIDEMCTKSDDLLHLDAREILAMFASDTKISEGLHRKSTLYDSDNIKCGRASTQVIQKSSVFHRQRVHTDPTDAIDADQIELASLVYKDRQGITYCTEIELLESEGYNALGSSCRSVLACLISALRQSGDDKYTARLSPNCTVVARYVAEHGIIPLTRWW